ncbi:PREDICTED: arginine--tRNA ligase, cytoplasmic-like isoform X1 [Lupinus angustifolius]|uniref:arginine--tRNA ligase, cytoplasmic-like isoform X1 n=1 Tax=Lupinus angustifolius TaxID=3871 RepID=UPI00092F081B|nr:PREDICTED: arginine--tRNA ligase, cytoplasmic-like isoform X1 [Lupinus angustifolius]
MAAASQFFPFPGRATPLLLLQHFTNVSRASYAPQQGPDLLKKLAYRRFALTAAKAQFISTMSVGEDNVSSVKRRLAQLFETSLRETVPGEPDVVPIVDSCSDRSGGKFGDYQCNNAMVLWSKIKGKQTGYKGPPAVGKAIMTNLPPSEMIESCSVAGPGFVNVVLSKNWIAQILLRMLIDGIDTWAPLLPVKTAVVDFSSPNIAKEMHVGHLRSTIIGDTLARMLEFSHVKVLRRNHVGDWGTQFGMLIEFLFEKFPNPEEVNEAAIGDLQAFYKASKLRFDSDPEFKQRAQQAVVRLQGGEDRYRKAWKKICEISRTEFHRVYERLGVSLEEKGESFYNPYIPGVLDELDNKGLIKESEGARVIFVDGVNIPLIVVKSDGGYNYASTDLAALWYRLNEEKAEWIIYVTDVGQQQHFDMFFKAAKRAGWLPADDSLYPKATHVGFGLVLGEDGKRFRTRNTEVVRLVDLLDEAKSRSKTAVLERDAAKDWPEEEVEKTAEAVGYGAVKYADLKNNRLSNYTFNFDQMLNDKGNTAVYLLYAHARICSIIRKSGKDIEELKKNGKIVLDHDGERALGLHLVQFSEIVEEASINLLPSTLCDYLYNLSDIFTKKFYSNCQVIGSPEETSRLLLCEATAIVMRKCFYLLGIEPVYKI